MATTLCVGDRVIGAPWQTNTGQGSWQQYAVIKEKDAVSKNWEKWKLVGCVVRPAVPCALQICIHSTLRCSMPIRKSVM